MNSTGGQRIAVVGSGVAGLGAAWALNARHDVTVFEAGPKLGGHANTVEVNDGARTIPVDTGFIVFNEVNYPNLVRLFDALGVASHPSDMSFGVSIERGSFEYRGSARGFLHQPGNLLDPSYRRMISDILRFQREAAELLSTDSDESIAAYLGRSGYSRAFIDDFLLPMIGCIWSSSLEQMESYPARTLISFLENHGLLQLRGRPRWRTVTGGSRTYVGRIQRSLRDVRVDSPVLQVVRHDHGVTVRTATDPEERFDQVVFATHADTTLAILGTGASAEERELLGAFNFSRNRAVLHTDESLMPLRRRVWSSWNYLSEGRTEDDRRGSVSLSYWMNRLQGIETRRPLIVTLNPAREPRNILGEWEYDHPIFDQAAVAAQQTLPAIQGENRSWFAGAWTGYGFHEDGLRSGLAVAAALGARPPWATGLPALGTPAPSTLRTPAFARVA